jgi:hypothetical protein
MPDAGEPGPSVSEPLLAILDDVLGFSRSAWSRASVLGDGTPIPMMSYGLVEYWMGLDLSGWDVLEVGGGQSTRFWLARARSVRTIEHDATWLPDPADHPGFTPVLIAPDTYPQAIRAQPGPFDLVILDCAANRYECALPCADQLRPGGAIILDNSDWHPNTAALLRERDLIQIDFPDFRPQHATRATASIFLHRDFRPRPLGRTLPRPALGGLDEAAINAWDYPPGTQP